MIPQVSPQMLKAQPAMFGHQAPAAPMGAQSVASQAAPAATPTVSFGAGLSRGRGLLAAAVLAVVGLGATACGDPNGAVPPSIQQGVDCDTAPAGAVEADGDVCVGGGQEIEGDGDSQFDTDKSKTTKSKSTKVKTGKRK